MAKPLTFNYITDSESAYKNGLDHQREQFKNAKFNNDYDSMCDAIENIKSEIKQKLISKGLPDNIKRIEKVTRWYRNLESKYIKNTPEGKQVVFPGNIHNKVNHNLTIAFELIIKNLDILELL
jgi:hypothetical protein